MCYIGILIAITLSLQIISGHETMNISFTSDGLLCIGACKSQDGGEFCATQETRVIRGDRSLSPCVTSRETHRQYFTYPIRGLRLKCNGLCGTFGFSYSWCFIGDDGAWNLCSPLAREPISGYTDCFDVCFNETTYDDYYACTSRCKNENDRIACPSPVIPFVTPSALGRRNDYATRQVRRKRQLDFDRDYILMYGVEEAAKQIEKANRNVPYRHRNSPINSYVVRTVYASEYRREVNLTLVVKAIITKRHIDNAKWSGRPKIPSSVATRMTLMDKFPTDEKGHLLAHSLGGPNEDFNFAPQTPQLNRNRNTRCGWFEIENYIRRFLSRDSCHISYVNWTLVVDFDLTSSRRPVGFALRHIYYPSNRIVHQHFNSECYFYNDFDF